MSLMDRPFTGAQRVGFAARVAQGVKGAWGRYVARLEETELTEAQCKDAGIEWGDLEHLRARRAPLIK